jgi:hypothetical protein
MARLDDLSLHLLGTRNSVVEIVEFKPQENAISIRPNFGIPEWTVMVLDVPVMQLEDQGSMRDQSFIIRTAVVALTAKEALIPTTARLDVMDADEGLKMHFNPLA